MLTRHILPALGELKVAEVERKHILAFQYELRAKPTVASVPRIHDSATETMDYRIAPDLPAIPWTSQGGYVVPRPSRG